MRLRTCVGGVGLVGLMTLAGVAGAQSQGPAGEDGSATPPKPDAAVQVTSTPSEVRAHAVPAVAVHPDDPQTIAIADGEAYGGQCSVHVSTDAGLTWTSTAIEQHDDWPECVYANLGPIAALTFGPDGTLYYAYSGFQPSTYKQRMFLARSTDLGRSFETTKLPWVEPDLEEGEFGGDALPTVAVDPNNPDRVYVSWMSNNGTWNLSDDVLEGQAYYDDIVSRPYVAASQDGGDTFAEPVDVAGDLEGWMSEPHLAIGEDGQVFAFFGENTRTPEDAPDDAEEPQASLHLATSEDGGETYAQEAIHTREPAESDWLSAPSPAVDPTNGDLYVVWEETGGDAPMVAFMRSSDGGASWSEPVAVNDVEPERDWTYNEFFASMDVSPSGRIDVAWYDWRNDVTFTEGDESNALQDVYYASSRDGGESWTENVKVTDRAIDRRLGVWDGYGVRGPIGLASTDAAAYVAWSDTRNSGEDSQSQDIYFTRVHAGEPDAVFAGTPAPGGNPWLWGLGGAGAALALGGLVLLLGTRLVSRGAPRPAKAKETAGGTE